jgi:hypothetical protein
MPPLELAPRVVSLCLVLAGLETLNGAARVVLVAPRLGPARARWFSLATGCLLAGLAGAALIPPMRLQTVDERLALGLVLAAFMGAFDAGFGRLAMKLPWERVLADFDPRTGNPLFYGLVFLIGLPSLVAGL